MTAADVPIERLDGAKRAVIALGLTQMTAWGTTYYLPGVLADVLQRDLGLSSAAVFSSVAIMLITSALLAWPIGRLMDRDGAGQAMPAGSLLLAAGLVVLGFAQGYASYAASWVLMGVGMALAMSNAAMSAITQIAGQEARRGMIVVMLFGGMAATVFWPLTLWLEGTIGWRNVCFVYAGVHALACAPVHRVFLATATSAERRRDLMEEDTKGIVPPERRPLAALLILLAVAGNGFVSWGLDLHLIAILQDFGLSAALAVAVAAWKGPATLLARGIDVFSAGRITPMGSALAAGILVPLGLAMPLINTSGLAAGVIFISVFSFGTGLMTVARATLPLALLGAQGFATTVGRLTLPTQVIYALSPMTFGWFLDRHGLTATIWIALAASLVSCAALLLLSRLTKH